MVIKSVSSSLRFWCLIIPAFAFLLSSCTSTSKTANWNRMAKHFHVRKAQTKQLGKEWVIILPGYSGLKVFKDTSHYFLAAQEFNAQGYDVVVVEYKKAYRKSGVFVKGGFDEHVRWTTEQCIEWAKSNNMIESNQDGHIASWSAGGEGMMLLMNDSAALAHHRITSIAMFYPSNRDSTEFKARIPVFVQTGAFDNVTPAKSIKKTFGNQPKARLVVYADAHHGFDVKSIVKEKHLQIPPVLGKKFIFQYNPTAADGSLQKVINFFNEN